MKTLQPKTIITSEKISFLDQKYNIFEYLVFSFINRLYGTNISFKTYPQLKTLLTGINTNIDLYKRIPNFHNRLFIITTPQKIVIKTDQRNNKLVNILLREISYHARLFLYPEDTVSVNSTNLSIELNNIDYTHLQKQAFSVIHKQFQPQEKKKIKIKRKKK